MAGVFRPSAQMPRKRANTHLYKINEMNDQDEDVDQDMINERGFAT